MTARNTLLFGAALAVSTAAIAYDHATHPVPPRPSATSTTAAVGPAPCAAGAPVLAASPPATAPCAAGAPQLAAPQPPPATPPSAGKVAPPPPPAQRPAAPPPPPRTKPAGEEAPDLVVDGG